MNPSFTEVLPYTLIAGLFLSNFPEALSASLGMKKSGMSTGKIMLMWMSLVLIIAIGALGGYYVGASIPHEIEIGIEGLAAGAMLTMIAQTMIPEAVHIGGAKVVGLSTLIGYLSAVAFKLFE
jgi:zinc transporter ZupT